MSVKEAKKELLELNRVAGIAQDKGWTLSPSGVTRAASAALALLSEPAATGGIRSLASK